MCWFFSIILSTIDKEISNNNSPSATCNKNNTFSEMLSSTWGVCCGGDGQWRGQALGGGQRLEETGSTGLVESGLRASLGDDLDGVPADLARGSRPASRGCHGSDDGDWRVTCPKSCQTYIISFKQNQQCEGGCVCVSVCVCWLPQSYKMYRLHITEHMLVWEKAQNYCSIMYMNEIMNTTVGMRIHPVLHLSQWMQCKELGRWQ